MCCSTCPDMAWWRSSAKHLKINSRVCVCVCVCVFVVFSQRQTTTNTHTHTHTHTLHQPPKREGTKSISAFISSKTDCMVTLCGSSLGIGEVGWALAVVVGCGERVL